MASMKTPLVAIKAEALEDLKEESIEEDEENKSRAGQVIVANPSNNNIVGSNSISEARVLKIKEEPPDPDEEGVVPREAHIFEIDASKTLTIKAEPRVDAEEEEDVDVEDDADSSSLREEMDIEMGEEEDDEDDLNDLDFEPDSSEAADTPDSRSKMTSSNSDGSIDIDVGTIKEEPNLEEELRKDENFGSSIPEEAEELLDSSAPKKGSFEFDGMRIETIGNYSKCPKCRKNIKSTFIIRHIKLHDLPDESHECPEKGCGLKVNFCKERNFYISLKSSAFFQVNRINNLFRHLKVVHKSKKPYLCKHSRCKERFSKPSLLRDHFSTHRSERRKEKMKSKEEDEQNAGEDRVRIYATRDFSPF